MSAHITIIITIAAAKAIDATSQFGVAYGAFVQLKQSFGMKETAMRGLSILGVFGVYDDAFFCEVGH